MSAETTCQSRTFCRTKEIKYMSIKEMPGKTLNGTILESKQVANISSCIRLCLLETECFSMNFIGENTTKYKECVLLQENIHSNRSLLYLNASSTHLFISVSSLVLLK